eukprot:5969635-Alexandrium_andersonii.AAC.1
MFWRAPARILHLWLGSCGDTRHAANNCTSINAPTVLWTSLIFLMSCVGPVPQARKLSPTKCVMSAA